MLRAAAEMSLAEPVASSFDSTVFVAAPDKGGFVNARAGPQSAPWIALGGVLPEAGSSRAAELSAAASLTSLFRRVRADISDAEWVYYLSKDRFTVALPFEKDALYWTDALLAHDIFQGATPQRDPSRSLYWSRIYLDEGGRGQMCSVVMPVDDAGRVFRGVVGIDFTLHELSRIIQRAGLDLGRAYVLDSSGQVLAQSSEQDYPQVPRSIVPVLGSQFTDLLTLEPERYHRHEGWLVLTDSLAPSPWKLLFVVDRLHLELLVLQHMAVQIMGLLLVFGTLILLEGNRRISGAMKKFRAAVENSSASIMITDEAGSIEYVNGSFTTTTGYTPQEVIGRKPSIFKSGGVPEEVYAALWKTILSGKSWAGELLNKKRDGALYWERIHVSPIFDAGGKIISFVSVRDDITEKRLIEEELFRLSRTDALTNVANRRHFVELLGVRMAEERNADGCLSLLILDIDHFKRVNDDWGHATGDRAIAAFAGACVRTVRKTDVVARLGGEEFGVLLPGASRGEACEIAECARRAVAEICLKADDGTSFRITASIGVATFALGDTLEGLLARADGALYQSKRDGRNRTTVAGALVPRLPVG